MCIQENLAYLLDTATGLAKNQLYIKSICPLEVTTSEIMDKSYDIELKSKGVKFLVQEESMVQWILNVAQKFKSHKNIREMDKPFSQCEE